MTMAMTDMQPGKGSWGMAAGLSLAAHVALASVTVLAVAHAPSPSPQARTEIMVQSIPLVAGGGAEAVPRLGTLDSARRQAATDTADRLAPETGADQPQRFAATPAQRLAADTAAMPTTAPETMSGLAPATEALPEMPRALPPAVSAEQPPAPAPATRLAAIAPQPAPALPPVAAPVMPSVTPSTSVALPVAPSVQAATPLGDAVRIAPQAAVPPSRGVQAQPPQMQPPQTPTLQAETVPTQPVQTQPVQAQPVQIQPIQARPLQRLAPGGAPSAAQVPETQAPERQAPETATTDTPTAQPEIARPQAIRPQAIRPEAAASGITGAVPLQPQSPAAPPQSPAAPQSMAQIQPQNLSPSLPQTAPRSLSQQPVSQEPSQPAAHQAPSSQVPPSQVPRALAAAPPPEDSLMRALRDRPRRALGDRQAAPRAQPSLAGGVQAPAPDDPAASDQGLYAAILQYLRNLPEIGCFAALPALGADGLLRFEVFGPATAGLEAFRDGLEAETGLVPAMVLRAITQGQCDTLDFIRAAPDYPAHGLYFTLDTRAIASGTALRGQIDGADGQALHLLLIDNSGRVQVLDRFIQDSTRFAIPMTLQGDQVETWQLLMALAVPRPLNLLQQLSGPQAAGPLFAALRDLTANDGSGPGIALVAFALR